MAAKEQPIDKYSRELDAEVRHAVHDNSAAGTDKRREILWGDYPAPDALRHVAGQLKQHVVENLDRYLEQAEDSLRKRGVQVHWAADGEAANRAVLDILRARGAKRLVKAKSMVSEETELADYLAKNGVDCLETDLGEFIVQVDGDHPSHIVKPIIHKNRRQIARTFEREGLGDYNDDPEVITRRARVYLRKKYFEADAGLTGANFVVADSGRIVLVTNEGNSRFCLAPTPVHIAMVGIEKLVPRDADLPLMLNLLARSATGQRLTVYTEFISGRRAAEQPDGPEEMHVIFLDNGRSEVLASDCRSILRCIRCGACLNVCPVYRQASGHAYRSVYPGPVGAVLSPLLAGKRFPELADLPKASSLCGACNEVCPVDIPIPDLLLRLRDRAKREGIASPGTPPMGLWASMATSPGLWRAALGAGKAMDLIPKSWIPVGAFQAWHASRDLPPWGGGRFRRWLKRRRAEQAATKEPS
ncbi:MAG: iron-sulfur cluster-binding protein [Puniceicoccaceae bacterium]|nr:MAG: iron-sulfur cluster-binding protein [Puniceicoccaceae bacterium]